MRKLVVKAQLQRKLQTILDHKPSINALRNPQRRVLALYFWISTTLITATSSFLITLAHLITKENDTYLAHKIATLWGKAVYKLVPFWTYEVEGRDKVFDKTYVIISNHSHLTDIWALYLTGLNFRWISKKEVFDIPFVGRGMKGCGYISLDRKCRKSRQASLVSSKKHLLDGNSMLIFPEGKRNLSPQLLQFKPGAFKLAEECKLKVLPIVISGATDLFEKGTLIPKKDISI